MQNTFASKRYKECYDVEHWADELARSLKQGGTMLWVDVDGKLYSVYSYYYNVHTSEFILCLGIHHDRTVKTSDTLDNFEALRADGGLRAKTSLFAIREDSLPPEILSEDWDSPAANWYQPQRILYPYQVRTTRKRTILMVSRVEPSPAPTLHLYHLRLQNGNSIVVQARDKDHALELAGITGDLEKTFDLQGTNEDEKLDTLYSLMQKEGLGPQKYEIQVLTNFFCEIPLTNTILDTAHISSEDSTAELMKLYPTLATQMMRTSEMNETERTRLLKEVVEVERSRLLI